MSEQPRIEERESLPYLAVTASGEADDFASAADTCFPELFQQLAAHGVEPAGPPFIRYRQFSPGGRFEIEICAPVAAGTAPVEPLHADALPSGEYAVYTHRGAYRATSPEWQGRDLAAAHELLGRWSGEQGINLQSRSEQSGPRYEAVFETYLAGPPIEPEVENWRTEIGYLLA